MAISTAPEAMIDVRPYLARNEHNPISVAEGRRDQIVASLRIICRELGVEAMIAESPPFSASVWVQIVMWRRTRAGGAEGRCSAVIEIVPKPFHRFTEEFTVKCEVCGHARTLGPLAELAEKELRELVRYIGGFSTTRPALQQLRVNPFHFWLPRNRAVAIRPDYLAVLSLVLIVVAFAFFAAWPFASMILLVTGIAGFVYLKREPRFVLSTGRPAQEPRDLARLDSWQVSLRGAGAAEADLRARIAAEIAASRPPDSSFADENIGYWGVDGREERRQMVVTFRRALAFVQIYAYHSDLYVAWDTHVNRGTWGEIKVIDGVDPTTGFRVVANSIGFLWHSPNEYDVTDASYLSEWVHALVVERVKEIVEERKISQEIDFKVLREERRGVVGAAQPAQAKRNIFKRVA